MVAIVFHLATVLVPLAGMDQDVKRVCKKRWWLLKSTNKPKCIVLAFLFSWVWCALCTWWLCWKEQLFLSSWLAWCTL